MPETDAKSMNTNKFSPLTKTSKIYVRNLTHLTILFLAILSLALSFGCAPPPNSASNDLPELTDEMIKERINYVFISDVAEESGIGDPISWRFDDDEPKEITIVEKQMQGTRATIILDIKTGSPPKTRNPRSLAGRIRTEWELKTGMVLRQWEIVDTENISMKYKNLPRQTEQNSNR